MNEWGEEVLMTLVKALAPKLDIGQQSDGNRTTMLPLHGFTGHI
jgi:hypothetical protein